MNIPFFNFHQSWSEFIGRKSNKTAVAGIILSAVGFYLGQVDYAGMTAGILAGLALISHRDTVARSQGV